MNSTQKLSVNLKADFSNMLVKASFQQKEQVFIALCEIIEKVQGDRDGDKINRIEKGTTRFLINEWNKIATKTNRSAVKVAETGNQEAPFTQRDMNRVLKRLDKGFKNIDNNTKGRVAKDTKSIYKTNKRRFIQQFKLRQPTKKAEPPLLTVSFNIEDTRTIDNIARLETLAIGTHFEKNLRPTISKLIKEGVVDKGMNKKNAGLFLQRELTRKLGGKAFLKTLPRTVSLQGQASVNAYFTGLSATHVNFARNFGQINAMEQAEVDRYQIVIVEDRRTSKICLGLAGRTFELKMAKEHMEKVLGAEDVNELKEIAGWRKDLSEFNLRPGQKLDNASAAKVLSENGMSMPPYHFRCRTEVHPA